MTFDERMRALSDQAWASSLSHAEAAKRGFAEAVAKEYAEGLTRSRTISDFARKMAAGTATHIDTHALAEACGETASRALIKTLTPEAVGAVMERELAAVTVDPVLRANYSIVTSAGAEVQRRLYKKAGFGLDAQTPELDADRLQGIIDKLCEGEYINTRRFVGEPIVNFTEHVVDALVRRNAEFQTRAGFEPYVSRILAPGCCDWCAAVAGRVPWSKQPAGMWRRHEYCRCVMDYNPEKVVSRGVLAGSASEMNSKKWVIY